MSFIPFDPNDDAERLYLKFLEYYGEFTERTRNSLLSKNIDKTSDVFEISKEPRKELLKKNEGKESDVLELSEGYRNELLKRNGLKEIDLKILSEAYRQELLKRNGVKKSDILSFSEQYRNDQLSKNVPKTSDNLSISEPFRDDQLSKNVEKTTDNLGISEPFRNDQLSKNVPKTSDNLSISEPLRNDQLSKNVPKTSDNLSISEPLRNDQLSKNVEKNSDALQESELYRRNQLSKNIEKTTDNLSISEPFRNDQLSKNVEKTTDNLSISEPFRDDQLSKNVEKTTDNLGISESFRNDQLSKNVPKTTDNLSISEPFRDDQLSKNVEKNSDALQESESFRRDQLSKNVEKTTDILQETESFRDDQLSKNVEKTTDNLEISEPFRDDQLSKNVEKTTDNLSISEPFRDDQLSKNVPKTTDNLEISEPFRGDQLSKNVEKTTDNLEISEPFRDDQLSKNVPKTSDNLEISEPFRRDQLSKTIRKQTDNLRDSQSYRNDLLSKNVPQFSDLLEISEPYRQDQLSSNVPFQTDIEQDSIVYRTSLLAQNIPNNSDLLADTNPFLLAQLAQNVPSYSDLLADTNPFLLAQLAQNVPSYSDLLVDSIPFLNANLSQNVPSYSDLLADTNPFLLAQLAQNIPSSSDVLNDSQPARDAQLSANQNLQQKSLIEDTQPYRDEQLSRNKGFTNFLSGGIYGVSLTGFGTQAFLGTSRNFLLGAVIREILLARNDYTPRNPYNVATDAKLLKGNFPSYYGTETIDEIEKQLFRNVKDNGTGGLGLKGYGLNSGWSLSSSSPEDAMKPGFSSFKSNGTDGAIDISKPEALMAKTAPGNPLDYGNPFDISPFKAGPNNEGIKGIMRKIGSDDNTSPMSINYKYGSRTFIVGVKSNGENKVRRQRYSVLNPYAPTQSAGNLIFSITNYAILEGKRNTMYFPAYIQSFQETENANYNEHQFLGRVEPYYTYSNSKRSGSITFYVLTDFAQRVELGIDYESDGLDSTYADFEDFHFTDYPGGFSRVGSLDKINTLESKREILSNQISDINEKLEPLRANYEFAGGEVRIREFPSGATTYQEMGVVDLFERQQAEIDSRSEEIRKIDVELENERELLTKRILLAESNIDGINVYSNINRNIISESSLHDPDFLTLRETKERLDEMKRGLQFQPTYFSGDKIDFRRRMGFLSRATRPSRKEENTLSRATRPSRKEGNTGFSFTKAPICHIRLGDWLHHDCVITDITKEYSETIWTLETNEVQPMWATVTMSFVILGEYGAGGMNRVLTASEENGFYDFWAKAQEETSPLGVVDPENQRQEDQQIKYSTPREFVNPKDEGAFLY